MMAQRSNPVAAPIHVWLPATVAAISAAMLVWLPWPIGGVLLLAGSLVLLGVVLPGAALALLIVSIPLQDVGSITIGMGELTATRLGVVALVCSHAINVVRGQVRLRFGAVAWAHAIVVGALIASVINAVDFGAWISEVYRWGVAGVVFVIADDLLQRRSARLLAIFAIGLGVLGASLFSFLQVVTVDGPPSYIVGGLLRAYSTFGAPNSFAAYLELGLPLLVVIALSDRSLAPEHRWLRWWCAVASLVGGGALVLTQSRGGYLGIAAALTVVAVGSSRKLRLATAIVVLLIAVGLILPIGESVRHRFSSLTVPSTRAVEVTPANWANIERAAHWGAGWRMMARYPLSGVGAGQYNLRYREFTPEWRFRIPRGHAHNGYIHMGAQGGIPGLLAMAAFATTLLISTGRAAVFKR
jgi:O-antigen ligase